jgi:serine/threonine-protein kinase
MAAMATRTFRPGELPDSTIIEHLLDDSTMPPHLTRARVLVTGDFGIGSTLPGVAGPNGLVPTLQPGGTIERQPDLLRIGEVLEGKYEIKKLIGSGGMGQVFEARDLGLNRLVAVKMAWPHVGPEPLRREAQVLAAFKHPGLVTAHALGSHRGRDFIVMERLSGLSLAAELVRRSSRDEAMSLDEALSLLLSIANTLSLIHASGLAHSDLKPANIMLVPGGRVVLLDFGIVRIEQLRNNERLVSGSPHYMAPETIRALVRPGEAHLVDVYALGVIAFVLLTGRPPFDHADPVELMMQHLERVPPRPSAFRADVPVRLERLVLSMLAKRPEERPHSVEEVVGELRGMQARLASA